MTKVKGFCHILKAGARGSFIAHNGEVLPIPPAGIDNVIDTTGAGDLWAAGFLHGLVSGYPLEKCGQMGSVCSYEVCQVLGANIPDAGWKRIRMLLNNSFKN